MQKLRRYTGLNHLAQAARGVLKSSQSIKQMQEDYEKVDFQAIKDQIAWLHACDFDLISKCVVVVVVVFPHLAAVSSDVTHAPHFHGHHHLILAEQRHISASFCVTRAQSTSGPSGSSTYVWPW